MSYADWPVLKRLIPTLRKRYAELLPPERYRLIRRDGAVFLVNYQSWAGRTAIIHGIAERPQVDYLLRGIAARDCQLFLDIGAHMGTYALMVALHTTCPRIIAFEPDPRNFAHLEAHVLINNLLSKIERRAVALSDHDGTVPFETALEHDVWSKVSDNPSAAETSVPAARLDSIVADRDLAIAIKMDIEMHELQALSGMQQLLRNNRCFLQVECFPDFLPAFTEGMAAAGYRRIHTIANDHYFAPRS